MSCDVCVLQYMRQPNLPVDSVDSKDFMAHDTTQRALQQPEMVCPNAYGAKHLKSEVGLPQQTNTALPAVRHIFVNNVIVLTHNVLISDPKHP